MIKTQSRRSMDQVPKPRDSHFFQIPSWLSLKHGQSTSKDVKSEQTDDSSFQKKLSEEVKKLKAKKERLVRSIFTEDSSAFFTAKVQLKDSDLVELRHLILFHLSIDVNLFMQVRVYHDQGCFQEILFKLTLFKLTF